MSADDPLITRPGHYAVRDDRGRLHDLGPREQAPAGLTPNVVICRRVADYPHGQPPLGAGRTACARCAAPIAFNPAGPHQDRPKICMQCAAIAPLPMEPYDA